MWYCVTGHLHWTRKIPPPRRRRVRKLRTQDRQVIIKVKKDFFFSCPDDMASYSFHFYYHCLLWLDLNCRCHPVCAGFLYTLVLFDVPSFIIQTFKNWIGPSCSFFMVNLMDVLLLFRLCRKSWSFPVLYFQMTNVSSTYFNHNNSIH